MDYWKKLKDPRWQKKRLEILARDNFTCCDTGATEEELHVHHCYYAKGAPWETPNEYLLTLSVSAHEYRQGLEQRAKKALGRILSMSLCSEGGEGGLERLVKSMESITESEFPVFPVVVDDSEYSELKWKANK